MGSAGRRHGAIGLLDAEGLWADLRNIEMYIGIGELLTKLSAAFSQRDEPRYEELRREYAAMCSAIARETPEQKRQFCLELAAHLQKPDGR